MTARTFPVQRVTADPVRADGHSAAGEPGDCLRTAVAGMLRLPYDQVPPFARYRSWWEEMRRYGRQLGGDFVCVRPVDGSVRGCYLPDRQPRPGALFLASGPSPRGPYWHVVIVDVDLTLVHDPHPSGAGLVSVEEVFAFVDPYEPAPAQYALTTRKAAA